MAESRKVPLDWEKIKYRLREADGALFRKQSASGIRSILKKRAESFAAVQKDGRESEGVQAVVFTLAAERFAFESAYLKEVCPASEIVPVPCTPSFVLGIMSLRGEVISIIDLRKFFELPDRGISDMNRLLVLSSASMSFGVLADTVEGVKVIETGGLKKLAGVSPCGITLLDAGKLLADSSIIVYDTAEQA